MINFLLRHLQVLVLVFLIAFVLTLMASYQLGTVNEPTVVTITHKERVETQKHSGYLIFTDQGTYSNTDALLHGKFNSSDIYGRIEIGKRYRLTSYGWRIGVTSSYPNIINATLVE
jgi:hypothetical protein